MPKSVLDMPSLHPLSLLKDKSMSAFKDSAGSMKDIWEFMFMAENAMICRGYDSDAVVRMGALVRRAILEKGG